MKHNCVCSENGIGYKRTRLSSLNTEYSHSIVVQKNVLFSFILCKTVPGFLWNKETKSERGYECLDLIDTSRVLRIHWALQYIGEDNKQPNTFKENLLVDRPLKSGDCEDY